MGVFLCNLYGQRLWLISGCGFFFGFEVVGLLFWKGWMVEGVLRGLLCCETNDVMNKFLLPVIIHAKEGKEEKGYGAWLRFVGGEEGFYRKEYFMDCVGI